MTTATASIPAITATSAQLHGPQPRTDPPRIDPTLTEPIPVQRATRGWCNVAELFAVRNYRHYAVGQLFSNTGTWMARVAIDWLVLELTGNVALVGLAVTLQFAPTLVIGPWAGVISDRFPRLRTLKLTQSLSTIANAVLAVLVLSGFARLWEVLLIALVMGVGAAVDGPSRSAFVSELVGTAKVPGAISVNASIFQFGGLLGPAISGVLIAAVGSGWSIAINAAASMLAFTALASIRAGELRRATPIPRSRGQIREALRYAARKPTIALPLVMVGVVAIFGMNLPVLLTAAASGARFHSGASGYGLYNSVAALGALAGALLSARGRRLRLENNVLAMCGYGVVTVLAGLVPSAGLFLAALVGIGFSRLVFAMANEALLQLSTNLAIRGRIVSFYLMLLTGGQALGGVLIGWIAQDFGGQLAFFVAGGAPLLVALAIGALLIRRRAAERANGPVGSSLTA